MKKEEIIKVLKKYSYTERISDIEKDFYMEIIASRNIESIADKLQSKELSDEDIVEEAYRRYPYDSEGIPDSHSYSFCQGAEWYRDKPK